MIIQKIMPVFFAAVLALLAGLLSVTAYAGTDISDVSSSSVADQSVDDTASDCAAAQPRPVVGKEIQQKVNSYSMEWEHSSGYKTGIIEKIVLRSGTPVTISSGGCESYGVDYMIVVDGDFKKIPTALTDLGAQYDFLKSWIDKANTAGKELQKLGFKLKGLENILSMKKPYAYLEIYSYDTETTISLSDQDGFEVSDLKFVQLKNTKVQISISHGFIL